MEFIEASHREWCDMWASLAQDPLNHDDPICLYRGQCWEYMGSTEDHHHFRHLHHPSTDKREFAYVERITAHLRWAG